MSATLWLISAGLRASAMTEASLVATRASSRCRRVESASGRHASVVKCGGDFLALDPMAARTAAGYLRPWLVWQRPIRQELVLILNLCGDQALALHPPTDPGPSVKKGMNDLDARTSPSVKSSTTS